MGFSQRLAELIVAVKETPTSFGNKVGYSNGFIGKVISGKSSVSVDKLENIFSTYPDLNANWLLVGTGEMWNTTEKVPGEGKISPLPVARQLASVASAATPPTGTTVPIIDVRAAASAKFGALAPDFPEQLGTIEVPAVMLKRGGQYSCIQVMNDSMTPTIYPKDYVVIKHMPLGTWAENIKDTHIYVVVDIDGGINVKRLKNRLKNQGIIVCRSDNHAHPSYSLRDDEVMQIFEVCFKISFTLRNESADLYKMYTDLEDRMDELERRIS